MDKPTVDWIKDVVSRQNEWRSSCVNLIASENIMVTELPRFESPELYYNDFMHRYAEGEPYKRYYNGTKYADELEAAAIDYFKKKFNAIYADVRPISGAVANIAVFSAMPRITNTVVTNSLPSGGHITHNKMGTMTRLIGRNVYNFPTGENPFTTDVDKAIKLIRKVNPDFVVFGKSMFLFREPVKEIRDAFPDLTIVYDAAHVFGLVYQGVFQQPLKEGADIMTSSTHKTFPGPQGGLIILKNDELGIYEKSIKTQVFPGILSNHHLHRIPALLAAAIILDTELTDYAKRVVDNAKAFAEALYNEGFDVCAADYGFTETHQVVVDVSKLGGGAKVANELEKNGIICNKNSLPWDKSVVKPSGIRLGVQEMTLKGWTKDDFVELAKKFKKILG